MSFSSALNYFKTCEQINDNLPQLHNYLGSIYFKQNDIDLAIKHYRSAILQKKMTQDQNIIYQNVIFQN